jgi:CheY-like chemotaxis protein
VDQTQSHILVVDDDPTILSLVAAVLPGEGYQVAVADGGREAIEIAAQLHPTIILLDMRMPELDGWGVARELATLGLTPKIVIMSALSDRLDEIAREVGAAGYLSKPFDLDQLLAALKELSSG